MNHQLQKLYTIAQKDQRLIIGLMSGTSLDGLDIALCQISGHGTQTTLQLRAFKTVDYTREFKQLIREVFSKREVNQEILSGLNVQVALVHAELVLSALDEWKVDRKNIDLIASHGQTVYHAPRSLIKNKELPGSTLQIGDGDHLAAKTGIITLSDFRQKHVAWGGEGAPLAIYGDYLLFADPDENRILLNIGGISNISWIPSLKTQQSAYASDLGPGNTLMNQYMSICFQKDMDRDAQLARRGRVHHSLLQKLLSDNFFQLEIPKTTGPELFSYSYLLKYLDDMPAQIPHKDIMATLNSFTAQSIIQGIQRVIHQVQDFTIYVSGGGIHNPLLMEQLQDAYGSRIRTLDTLGLNPDAKEACLFAVLANQAVAGHSAVFEQLKHAPATSMGKICLPY